MLFYLLFGSLCTEGASVNTSIDVKVSGGTVTLCPDMIRHCLGTITTVIFKYKNNVA
jgi:hypothetical protein